MKSLERIKRSSAWYVGVVFYIAHQSIEQWLFLFCALSYKKIGVSPQKQVQLCLFMGLPLLLLRRWRKTFDKLVHLSNEVCFVWIGSSVLCLFTLITNYNWILVATFFPCSSKRIIPSCKSFVDYRNCYTAATRMAFALNRLAINAEWVLVQLSADF